jgi:hypothetical protein
MNGVMGLQITTSMQLYDIIIKQFYHAVVLFLIDLAFGLAG